MRSVCLAVLLASAAAQYTCSDGSMPRCCDTAPYSTLCHPMSIIMGEPLCGIGSPKCADGSNPGPTERTPNKQTGGKGGKGGGGAGQSCPTDSQFSGTDSYKTGTKPMAAPLRGNVGCVDLAVLATRPTVNGNTAQNIYGLPPPYPQTRDPQWAIPQAQWRRASQAQCLA